MNNDLASVAASLWTAFAQSSLFFYIKIIAGFVTAVLLIADILLIAQRVQADITVALYGTVVPKFNKEKYREKWAAILKRISEDGGAAEKISLVEADKILDEVLGKVGFSGKDAGEKLTQISPGQLVGIPEVMAAHQIAEKVLLDPSHEISPKEVRQTLDAYEKFFNALEIF